MRNALNEIAIDGVIVIGEGERDEAPMLYIGEKVGNRETGRASTSRWTPSKARPWLPRPWPTPWR